MQFKKLTGIIILALVLLSGLTLSSQGQNLNIGAGFNANIANQHDINLPKQYLYYDPFTYQYGPMKGINEISIVQLTDYEIDISSSLGINAFVSYRSKNRFISSLFFSTFIFTERLFYNRINIMQEYDMSDQGHNNYAGSYPELYYGINTAHLTLEPSIGYILVKNKMINVELNGGAFYRYNYFNSYDSRLDEFELSNEESTRNHEAEKILYNETIPGRTSYGLMAGLRLKYFSYALSLNYHHMINDFSENKQNSYLKSFQMLFLRLELDIFSFNLIKDQMNERF